MSILINLKNRRSSFFFVLFLLLAFCLAAVVVYTSVMMHNQSLRNEMVELLPQLNAVLYGINSKSEKLHKLMNLVSSNGWYVSDIDGSDGMGSGMLIAKKSIALLGPFDFVRIMKPSKALSCIITINVDRQLINIDYMELIGHYD